MGKVEVKSITLNQIKQIHVLIGQAGIDDDLYRAMLRNHFRADSCKELNYEEASELIASLRYVAEVVGNIEPRTMKYDNLGNRPGYATPKQLRKIEAMWSGVSRAKGRAGKAKALRKYLERFGVSDLRFVTKDQAIKIIISLKNFGVRNA